MTRRAGPPAFDGEGLSSEDVERLSSAAEELHGYVRATDLEPRDELRARIMAVLADEPTPAPLTAMASAARDRRAAGLISALRDLWRVALSGGRPILVRLPAALAVLVLAGSVGGVSVLAAAGAWTVLHPQPTVTPTPSGNPGPVVTPTVQPGASDGPMMTPAPSSGAMPGRSNTPMASTMPEPSMGPTASPMTRPTATMKPMSTSNSTASSMPSPTQHPGPTAMPGSSQLPGHP